ncbi:hypothetical protein [Bradyrhizobium oligotrophicum]|uniref:hypothetical protein n=1 Tax=Bradyrhizobium oligotrophicum TaxID=44255 RepID=UPI003EBE096C
MNQDIVNLLKAAVECSIFIEPADPGLTYQEILEVGQRAGYQSGEVGDAALQAGERSSSNKFITDAMTRQTWAIYFKEEPDYRNFAAFDFVVSQLNDRVRADGMRNAQIDRKIVVERAIAGGLSRNDIEAAITYQVLAGQLTEKDGVLRFAHNTGVRPLPSETHEQMGQAHRAPMRRDTRARAYPIVKDIIERRSDGRPQQVEPLDAFAEQLDKLQYGAFRLWWKQTVGELRRSDPNSSPVSVCVLAAALVEGALTFVVRHARNLNLGVFRSKDFDGAPRTWKIDDLVSSAASGSETAIFDVPTKNQAEILVKTRQRIHAGRMLAEFPSGVPDLRPEEARHAKNTAELVVRRILDWLEKYPPT